jgi:hypothetical protein
VALTWPQNGRRLVVEGVAQEYAHPQNPNARVFGIRLTAGDILELGDVYDGTGGSEAGTWQPCHCPGLVLRPLALTIWIRPVDRPVDDVAAERLPPCPLRDWIDDEEARSPLI